MTTLPSTRFDLWNRLKRTLIPLTTTALIAAVALFAVGDTTPIEAPIAGIVLAVPFTLVALSTVRAVTAAGVSRRRAWLLTAVFVHLTAGFGTAALLFHYFGSAEDTLSEFLLGGALTSTTPFVVGITAAVVVGPLLGVLLRDRLFDDTSLDQ